LTGVYLRLTKNWRALEKITAHEWMLKWVGKDVYESMWEPLLIGKFGPHYQDVPMSWFWARIHARTTQLGTFEGGFQAFCDQFAEQLRSLGVEIHLNAAVKGILRTEGGLSLEISGQTEQRFEQVLSTTSPGLMAKLAPGLPQEYLQGLLNLKHMGAVVLTLSITHQLSEQGYYWFNLPKNAGYPFLALVEHTNYVSAENFGGEHIIYCGDYLEVDHEYFDLSETQLLERFIPALESINPKFQKEWILKTWLHRTPYAQPVPELNHSKNIPSIETPIEGLYFASMSQVYPWDRGTNFAVEIGRRAAKLMMGSQ